MKIKKLKFPLYSNLIKIICFFIQRFSIEAFFSASSSTGYEVQCIYQRHILDFLLQMGWENVIKNQEIIFFTLNGRFNGTFSFQFP